MYDDQRAENTADEDVALLVDGTAALGLTLSAAQVQALLRYRTLLLEWNQRFNLTAITDLTAVLVRHFLDSLTCAPHLPETAANTEAPRLLDIGSGAGLPGLPLAIACPDWHVTLLEATGKKVTFLRAVLDDLALPNVVAVTGRAEEWARYPEQRAHYDAVTARAVASLPTLLEYCAPFLRVQGRCILPKKGDLTEELASGRRAASLLGARPHPPAPVTLPALADGRVILVATQETPCPPQYPRAAGAPTKQPLGMRGQR